MTRNNFKYRSYKESKNKKYSRLIPCRSKITAEVVLPEVTIPEGIIIIGTIVKRVSLVNEGSAEIKTTVFLEPISADEQIEDGCGTTSFLTYQIWYDPRTQLIYNVIGTNKFQFHSIDAVVTKLKDTGWISDDAKYDTSDIIKDIPFENETNGIIDSVYLQINS